MEFTESEMQLTASTISNHIALLHDLAFAKYSTEQSKTFTFLKNVLINLVGHFIITYSNHNQPNAVDRNFDQYIEALKMYKDNYKKVQQQNKDAH